MCSDCGCVVREVKHPFACPSCGEHYTRVNISEKLADRLEKLYVMEKEST